MTQDVEFRAPTVADGAQIWRIVRDSGVLDLNSAYLYLLLCKDFADTCIVAEQDAQLVGFATGYQPPGREDVIFLWQIGVDAAQRGRGLGKRLLAGFLNASGAAGVSYLETTISPSNQASQRLFRGLARDLGTSCQVQPCFTEEQFPSSHEGEDLYRIGPFEAAMVQRLTTLK
jgi:L-2,4-diaminobutyric acid acetyltransferase